MKLHVHTDPENVSGIIHHLVDGLHYRLAVKDGAIDRLKEAVAADCFITADSMPARDLAGAVRDLRHLADELDTCLAGLIGNTTATLIAAE